ncbi:MAG: hypothetical protein NC299_14975 [Lachnospiraceae bacterium]|nr:hypothetical protein [Ruminococcus sp.]MCM1276639.1 hypothetical protein [Lachnospiraceae bacterium]
MKQIERFIWNTAKSKLELKLPLKGANDPLLLCIEFNSVGERYYFGETKVVRQITEDSNCLSKHGGSILAISEQRPLGSLLLESYDFVKNGLASVENLFRSMLNSIDSGNSEKSSDYKMLEKLWQEGNAFQKIAINYFFCKFYLVKRSAASGKTGIVAYPIEHRRQMYSELERAMSSEFELLKQNPTTLTGLKWQHFGKAASVGNKLFCSDLSEFYSEYITYLSKHNLFFRICPRCGEQFYAKTSRRRYHEKCAELQDKDNKLHSQRELEQDNFYKLCQAERYSYNNFRRGKAFRNVNQKLQTEYLDLFEKFKTELAKKNEKLKSKDNSVQRQMMNKWLDKISQSRKDLEGKIMRGEK